MTNDTKATAPDRPSPDTPDATSQLQQERDDYYDLLLRKTAELDNYRKRVERERRNLEHAAATDLIKDLLPLADDLERALGADADITTAGSYREGVELIQRRLLEVLDKRGVTPIDATAQDFDPEVHQAVATEALNGHRDGEVIEELRRGYLLHGRLLRAAMVRVAKA